MTTSLEEAIILAGGFGTRLRKVVSDVPKPMAPMDDKGTPFLALVMHQLAKQGIARVILSVGYMAEVVRQYFGDSFEGMPIEYVLEDSPLGTGGAVKKALAICRNDSVFVLNGDTFLDVPLAEIKQLHERSAADFTIAAREMFDFDRYGALELSKDNRVLLFGEKKKCEHGYINGGVYCINVSILKDMPSGEFSLEQDYLSNNIDVIKVQAYKTDGYFVDIGIPEDYQQARSYFKSREAKY